MKFSLGIEKHKTTSIGQVKGHNERLHATESQLPKEAWFSEEGHQVIQAFRGDLIEKAKKLSKRKDAVLAVELSFQIGNMEDWREKPCADFPYGKPKPGMEKVIADLTRGAIEAAKKEVGEENIVSINLHLDETSPHIQVVFSPIFDGKLQAKHWLNGASSCGQFLERLHKTVNEFSPCTYTKSDLKDPDRKRSVEHDPAQSAKAKAWKTAEVVIEEGIRLDSTLKKRAVEVQLKEDSLVVTRAKMAAAIAEIKSRDEALNAREAALVKRESLLQKAEAWIQSQKQIIGDAFPDLPNWLQEKLSSVFKAKKEPEIVKPTNPSLDQENTPKTAKNGLPDALKSPANTGNHQKPR
jgi:hypothetical protein